MKFLKMHGLGNDFVILDERLHRNGLNARDIERIADRHFGAGCDQFVTFADDESADARIRFWNQDGSVAGACGNATRCIAEFLMREGGDRELNLRTERGLLKAQRQDDGQIAVNMGLPIFDWREIPLSREVDIDALPLEGVPMAVGMGNPHCVFFVDDAEKVDVAGKGQIYEHDALFPERTNVEFVSKLGEDHLRMRVWERGGMITLACGSGACAAGVAAHRRGVTGRKLRVTLDGGDMEIDWREDGVWMKGATQFVFEGQFFDEFLEA